jgi:hypothetical protein
MKIFRPNIFIRKTSFMAELLKEMPVAYEPLKSNRWVVRTKESFQNIPEWVVSDFKIESVDIDKLTHWNSRKPLKKGLKLTLHFRNSVMWMLTPDDVMNADNITIDFLDPVGTKVQHYDMKVEFDSLSLVGDYSNDDILTHEVTFWIKSMNPLAIETDIEKETFENYKEKQKSTQVES